MFVQIIFVPRSIGVVIAMLPSGHGGVVFPRKLLATSTRSSQNIKKLPHELNSNSNPLSITINTVAEQVARLYVASIGCVLQRSN